MQIDANHLNLDNNFFSKLSAAVEVDGSLKRKLNFELEKLISLSYSMGSKGSVSGESNVLTKR